MNHLLHHPDLPKEGAGGRVDQAGPDPAAGRQRALGRRRGLRHLLALGRHLAQEARLALHSPDLTTAEHVQGGKAEVQPKRRFQQTSWSFLGDGTPA